MAIGSKTSGARGSKTHKNHTKTVTRWVTRKQDEKADGLNRAIDDQALAGSRRNLWWQRCHLERVKADIRKAQRAMLETTSLKDLIK